MSLWHLRYIDNCPLVRLSDPVRIDWDESYVWMTVKGICIDVFITKV